MKLGRRQEGSILGAGNAQSLSRCRLLTLIIQLDEHIVLYVSYTEIKWFTKKKKYWKGYPESARRGVRRQQGR